LRVRRVVTSFLQSGEQVLLLKRSDRVGTHRGLWASVSGYVEGQEEPLERARLEIHEEVGLSDAQIEFVRAGETLRALDEMTETVWVISPFLFKVNESTIRLDWEHTEHRWIRPEQLVEYETVPKLRETFERVRWDFRDSQVSLFDVLREVESVGADRTRGASYLGRRALEILAQTVRSSTASDADQLFRDLLFVGLKLRKARPNMATIHNHVGKALRQVDATRDVANVQEFKTRVTSTLNDELEKAWRRAEDAARIAAATVMPESTAILTHSYSETIRRMLFLAAKSQHDFVTYVTESHPGSEGKQLAKDLIADGLKVKLVADTAAEQIITGVSAVIVGADSVLKDGSAINKVGTRELAAAANRHAVPFYVVAETAKFSISDLLGETPILEEIFDITPAEFLKGIVTEHGLIAPASVESVMRRMAEGLYP